MQLKTPGKIWVGYSAGLILFLVTFFFTFYQGNKLAVYTNDVRANSMLMNSLDIFINKTRRVESGYREFILSRQESVAPEIQSSYNDVQADLKKLYSMSGKEMKDEYDNLKVLLEDFYVTVQSGIQHYRSTGYTMDASMMVFGKQVLDKMQRINAGIVHIHEIQGRKLENDYQELADTNRTVKQINIFLFILSIALMVYSLISYLREHAAKQSADERNDAYAIELEKRVQELDSANKELATLKSLEKFAATGRIARTIAHEVRNPLTNINLAADQMKAQLDQQQIDADVLIQMIIRNSNRINQLISDLLNSTKFLELTMERHSVHKVLDESLEMAKDRIGLQSIKVEKSYSDDCEVMMDVEKMKIAFLNLIVNAIEAMEPGKGVLKVNTHYTDTKCIIHIADNGSGIDAESINRLFEPYFTNKQKGSGLGLTNTHNIIYTHKGTIEVQSAVNRGTLFIISLPK